MIITQTPLRLSFAGGGTDLPDFWQVEEGQVLSAAIDKYVFVIVSERFDDRIYVNYSSKEIVDSVDAIRHELVREAMRLTGVDRGVEVTMLADIPSSGSGLGSSSSLTVGLLNALHIFQGRQVPAAQLAEEACEVEIHRCGRPIGKQDQYIAAFGGIRQFGFRADGTVVIDTIRLSAQEYRRLGTSILLYYTDQTRKSAGILSEQKSRTAANLDLLRRLKRYVPQVRSALETRQFDLIGGILHESWLLKKQLASGVSNPAIDEMYDIAVTAGALGGKVAGAGGGGFLFLYVPFTRQDMVRNAMRDYREFPALLEQDGSKVIFNLRRQPAR